MSLKPVNHHDVKAALKQRQTLPTLPNTFSSLVSAISDPNCSLLELAEIISCDPTLTANVLRVANSSFMGLRQPVTDLPSAILHLGIFEIRRAALSVGAFDMFRLKPEAGKSLQNIWLHSLATGFISQQIATIGRFEFSDDAYLAGLLHDLGKLFFATFYTTQYSAMRDDLIARNLEGLALEREVFGITHVQVAEELCEHWTLPPGPTLAATFHHEPGKLEGDMRTLVLCVAVGNVLAHQCVRDEPTDHSVPQAKEWLKELAEKSAQPELMNMDDLLPISLLEAERARYFEEIVSHS